MQPPGRARLGPWVDQGWVSDYVLKTGRTESGGRKLKAVRVTVRGKVQRVGYRRYLLDSAQEEGVSGYARNVPDGSVAVFAQGEPRSLRSFLKKLRSPPRPAKVRNVEERSAKPSAKVRAFRLVSGGLAEEMQEGFGAMQSEFGEHRSEFKGFKAEFRDYRSEFSGFASRTDGDLSALGGKLDSFASRTGDDFSQMNARYGEISDKLSGIMAQLTEQAKRSQETLDAVRTEAAQTAQTLNESLGLLKEAVERLPRQP